MTPEMQNILNGLIQLLILALTGGVSGVAISKINQTSMQRNYKIMYQEATEKLIENHERIEQQQAQIKALEARIQQQDNAHAELVARLTILTEERAAERATYLKERDEIMMERGRVDEKLRTMQIELDNLRKEIVELRNAKQTLQEENRDLARYKTLSDDQAAQITRIQTELMVSNRELAQARKHIEALQDQVNRLRNPDPEPPTPKILPRTGTE